MISCVRLSVCLSVVSTKTPVLQIQAVLLVLNTFKLCKMLKTCLVYASFARHSLQMLKTLHLSWHRGHTCQPHPDTWPPVQRETTVSVFLGFTIQHAFVRRQFVPILKESARIAMWPAGYVLYSALVHFNGLFTVLLISD